MDVLPLISYDWRVRVHQGARGKLSGGTLLRIVSTSDFAFAFTVLHWGAKKKWALNSSIDLLREDDGSESDGYEAKLSGGEKMAARRGRKKGEEGFATQENVRIFNMHGNLIEDYLFGTGKKEYISAWEEAAMMWVNRETVDEGEEPSLREVKTDNRVVPFVPRQRSEYTLIARV